MRVAFFGGSFDPPHLGHARIAQAAAGRLSLDRVLLAPVGLQPLKREALLPGTWADRVAMLRLLLGETGDARLEVSELDRPREDGKPNYTFESILALREQLRMRGRYGLQGQTGVAEQNAPGGQAEPGARVFLLVGADSLETLPQWHRALDLVLATDLIIAARPGFPRARGDESLLRLAAGSHLEQGPESAAGMEDRVLVVPSTGAGRDSRSNIYLLDDLDEDISATGIRAALAEDPEATPPSLSPGVAAYIRAHGLYRPARRAG